MSRLGKVLMYIAGIFNTNCSKALSTKMAMKKRGKDAKGKPMKCPPTSRVKCRNKDRFVKLHMFELPDNVQQLLKTSSVRDRGPMINEIVAKDKGGQWCFKLDSAFLQETV